MKLTLILLTTAFLHVSAEGVSQNISFSGENVPLRKALAEIKRQTGYAITYTDDILVDAKPVSLNMKNVPLREFLDKLFIGQEIRYTIFNKSILLSRKLAVSRPSNQQSSQSNQKFDLILDNNPIDVKGRIVNEKGEPVIVTVTVKGTKNRTSTNANGEFELKGVDENATLVITGVSVETIEWKVEGRISLALAVKTKITENEAIVVSTGYQDIKQTISTGSFVKIDNELFNRKVSSNLVDRLLDVTSGLVVNKNTGIGSASPLDGMMIRNISTISASKYPLLILDDFPYDGDLNNINPNDIESVTILRDAAAASIWGVRAGNGVIVVKTKKGRRNQRMNIQLSSTLGIAEKPDLFYVPTITSNEFVDYEIVQFNLGRYNSRLSNTTLRPIVSQAVEILDKRRRGIISAADSASLLNNLRGYDVRNDIDKYLLQTGVLQQYTINVSGGNTQYQYYGSIGYDENRSSSVGNKSKRLTIRFDNTYRVNNKIELTGFMVHSRNTNENNGFLYSQFLPTGTQVAPYSRLADDFGNSLVIPKPTDGYRLAYIDTAIYPGLLDWHYKPLDELKYADNNSSQYFIRLGTGIKYNVTRDINFEVKYILDKQSTDIKNVLSQETYFTRNLINRFMSTNQTGSTIYPVPLGGIINNNNSDQNAWNVRGQLNLAKKWDQHNITVLAGIEFREVTVEGNTSRQYGYNSATYTVIPVDYVTQFNTRPSSSSRISNSESVSGSINRYGSYYFNATYTFSERYVFSGSGRIDQSNFFGVKANLQKVPLWSTGFGWNVYKESFYKLSWLPYLKMRITFGYNGNTNNSANAYVTTMARSASLSPINEPFATLSSPPNQQLRWEKVKVFNVGIDFENSRLSGSVDFYKKNGIDLISSINIDPTSGVSSYTGNNASIKGRGIDVVLNTKNIESDFKWRTSFLFSYSTEKVNSYQVPPPTTGNGYLSNPVIVGKPLFKLFSYNWGGLDPNNGDARLIINGQVSNSNNFFNAKPEDVIYSGRAIPPIFGAVRNTFIWNNFNLSFNISYKLGYYFRRSSINYSALFISWGGHSEYALRWKKPGDEAFTNVPGLPTVSDNRDIVYNNSNILVEKADHIRLQDVRLSYDFNKSKFKRLPFQNIDLYLYANNIGIIWTANKYNIDPDASTFGNVPSPRVLSFGVRVDF